MTTIIDYNEIKEELIVFLRNADIFSTTERNVSTAQDTGTFSSTSTHLIAVTNIKNIRSITVGGSPITFGTDYTVDYDFLDTTIKTKITFTAAQTGAYNISYDYGSDIIFPDFPRVDLNPESFPRMCIDIIGDNSVENELDGTSKDTTLSFSVIVFDDNITNIDNKLKDVRTALIANHKLFYYLRYTQRLTTGALGYFGNIKNNIKMRNIDYLAPHNIEYS